jgi:hypothetical protein
MKPQTSNVSEMVWVLVAAAVLLLFFSALSLKTGKTIRGRLGSGDSPFVYRDDDPSNYWRTVVTLLGSGLFCSGVAIWIFMFGAH